MRIAILSWESLYSVAVGGVASHTSELAAALAARGHQLHFFTRRMPGQSAHDCIDGVHYHRCFYPGHRDFVEDINNMCRTFVDRVFEIEDFVGRFDLVHAHDWLTANAMIWIKQGRKNKTVLTIHSTEYDRSGNAFCGGMSTRIREQERAGTYWADRVIAVSDTTKKEIMWMYEIPEQKISVVGNGVNWKRFDIDVDPGRIKVEYGIGPLEPTVLFCGRLAWQKGPDILVEAIPHILSNHPNSKFIFVGEGDMRGSLQGRAQNLGVMHAIRFLGYKNGEGLVKLYKACDTVCVPSRSEPFGIVVLEAWSASKPAIVSENGGLKDLIRHEENGIRIYPRPDSVFWGINRVFSNFELSRQIGRNGRLFLEKRFGWDKITEEVIEVYQQVAPELKPQPVTQSAAVNIIEITVQKSSNKTLVESEAEIIPQASQDITNIPVLEIINAKQEKNNNSALQQKEPDIKIKGKREEVTSALCVCHKKLLQGGESSPAVGELCAG
jgi:glycogen synthase